MIPFALLLACVAEPIPAQIGWPDSGCSSDALVEDMAVRRDHLRLMGEDGVELGVTLVRPRSKGCYPGLLLVPPGFDPGQHEAEESYGSNLAQKGIIVMAFDPPGRGESDGEDDYNGPYNQDALSLVLSSLAAMEEVDPARVVIRSRSFGVAMAAGALSRHPELDPMALVDIEGPARLPDDLDHAAQHNRDTFNAIAEGDEWWFDRSAADHIGAFRGDYLRIQAQKDHALNDWMGAALQMLRSAQRGQPANVRLNETVQEGWEYEDVEAAALEGQVGYDDTRAVQLLLSVF